MNQRTAAWLLCGALVAVCLPLFAMATPAEDETFGLGTGFPGNDNGSDGAPEDEAASEGESGDDASDDLGRFTMAFVGDVLVHESVAENAKNADGDGFDFAPMFAEVAPALRDADVAICHLETPLSATNDDLSYYPAFRVPNQLAPALAEAGFDGCSFASNHTLDAGPDGVASTLDAMRAAGLEVAGASATATDSSAATYEVDDYTVGQLSYTYGLNAPESLPAGQEYLVDIVDAQAIAGEAAALRSAGANFVVVSLQWGVEYQTEPTSDQKNLALRLLSSPDIDLIVGHHAHVVQPIEPIGDEFVLYGLGNFLSNQSETTCDVCPASVQDGAIVTVTVQPTGDGPLGVVAVEAITTHVDLDDHAIIPTGSEAAIDRFGEAEAAASGNRTRSVLDANGTLG